jgi:transcription factor STE12
MTSNDVLKILLFRLEIIGISLTPDMIRKLEVWMLSDLRRLKEGLHWKLEPANSELVLLLTTHKSFKIAKKQKIYHWWSIPHDEILYRCLFRMVKINAPSTSSATEMAMLLKGSEQLKIMKELGPIVMNCVNDKPFGQMII